VDEEGGGGEVLQSSFVCQDYKATNHTYYSREVLLMKERTKLTNQARPFNVNHDAACIMEKIGGWGGKM